MFTSPIDVLTHFPIRKTKQQKQSFRDAIQSYVSQLGYTCMIEGGSFGCKNVVIGNPEQARYLVTAHYDTCTRMLLPNLVTPCNLFLFVLYQLLILLLIIIPSVIAGMTAGLLTNNSTAVGYTALTVYWLLLIGMFAGPANPSNANDNTSGVITLLEILRTLPENQRYKVCFVLFDLEEAGLVGSAAYRKKHAKSINHQIVLNMDCVGDGDYLTIFPNKKLQKDKEKLMPLYRICGSWGGKRLQLHKKGLFIYPSDQANFPYGAAIAAFHKRKGVGLYYSRIHTPKDNSLDLTNINILRAALTTFICCDAVQ